MVDGSFTMQCQVEGRKLDFLLYISVKANIINDGLEPLELFGIVRSHDILYSVFRILQQRIDEQFKIFIERRLRLGVECKNESIVGERFLPKLYTGKAGNLIIEFFPGDK